MPIQKQLIKPVGMMQDNLITSPKSNQFAHEIKNLRFNTQGDYVTASWTTEQSTLKLNIEGLQDNKNYLENQIPVGQAVINDQLILFTTSANTNVKSDKIIKFTYKDKYTLQAVELYTGNLNLDAEHPLETLVFYENDDIQKVYWTDGINQPRMINICNTYTYDTNNIDYQFDFVKEVALKENVTVSKQQGGAGQFPPCTVKYAITYYNKYGQESNIVWTSDLVYPTKGDRGLKEDELSGDIFVVNVKNVDISHKYDYIRLYSIIRTTDNATPVVRIVESKSLSDNPTEVTFYDSNTKGEIIDPTILNYLGGVKISVETFDQKDNTLFLGNINLKTKSLKNLNLDWESPIDQVGEFNKGFLTNTDFCKHVRIADTTKGFYPYKNQLNGSVSVARGNTQKTVSKNLYVNLENPKIFKYGEWYRFGVQCQDINGIWSDIIWIGDYQNTIKPTQNTINTVKDFPVFKYTLKDATVNSLVENGYKKLRLVCCYTNNNDRTVLAQGVVSPTVFNNEWFNKHSPDFVSSWFYRTNDVEPYKIGRNEIQSIIEGNGTSSGTEPYRNLSPDAEDKSDRQQEGYPSSKSLFSIYKLLLTFHSPDIEFDESLRTLDWSKIKFRKVGNVPQNAYSTKLYLSYLNKAQDYNGNKGNGFKDYGIVRDNGNINYPVFYGVEETNNQYGVWEDIDVYNSNFVKRSSDKGQLDYIKYSYRIYPFQRKYLNNYMGDCDIDIAIDNGKDTVVRIEESSIISNKVWSTLKYSFDTTYDDLVFNVDGTTDSIDTLDCKVFDSNEVLPLKMKCMMPRGISFEKGDCVYYGNVNTIVPVDTNVRYKSKIYEYQGLFTNGPKTSPSSGEVQTSEILNNFYGNYITDNIKKRKTNADDASNYMLQGVSSDPIQITYKSTPHCVISLNEALPELTNKYSLDLVELYRDVSEEQRFGGVTEDALKNNIFVPCGKAVDLLQYEYSSQGSRRKKTVVVGDIGDSYYMRYDNLKTYPYTREDVNSIVEIFSFMCETRINLDGRSDINRGLTDNTLIDNTNFNYINKSYTQTDNFFNYRVLDEQSASLDNFPNQLTWTKTKNAGEEIDAWTNITLANVADAEGTLGKITKICNNKNNLIMFQEHGIAMLGYNEKTAISTANGIPLEIANSGKFTGFSYYSKNIGCQNKWSINNNKNGVFWIDNYRRQLLTFGEGSPTSISTTNGFDAFFINNIEGKHTEWTPKDFNILSTSANFVTYYDNLSKDIYYINNDYCIAWNEITGTFTSFYDYNRIPYVSNVSQHCLMTYLNGNNIEMYSAREDDSYNKFFNESKPYWITLMSNGGSDDKGNYTLSDKVFNTIEYKGDLFDENNPVIYNSTNMINMPLFTDIAAYNGYQAYKEFKIDGRYNSTNNHTAYMEYPWKAERKFNIWRVIIPRATYNKDNELVTGKDRIRNPYTYIKLVNNEPERYFPDGSGNRRAIFSDFVVSFDIR